MQFGDNLFLFYTGNVRDENWVRHPYQIGALMDKDGKIEKIDKVLLINQLMLLTTSAIHRFLTLKDNTTQSLVDKT